MPKTVGDKEKEKNGRRKEEKTNATSPQEPTTPLEQQATPNGQPKRRLTRKEAYERHVAKIKEIGMARAEWTIARKEMLRNKRYNKYPWYWGMINQKEAEMFLRGKEDGTFLVRSEVVGVTKLFASLVDQKVIHHIEIGIQKSYWKIGQYTTNHPTLVDLVAHYQSHHMGLSSMRLKHVAKKPEWLIAKKKILAPNCARRLGHGNFSDVIIGAFQRRIVAIKLLTAQDQKDLARERDNMMKEFEVMLELQNPYITKAIGVMLESSPPMLLMEMMATTLLKHLETHGVNTTLEEKLLYCWQMARGLEYMASQGYVHRDVAARNALFSRFGILKISDFGLSDKVNNLVNWVPPDGVNLPMRWTAPEAYVRGATFTEKTDVWSFGVCFNEILQNGRKPADYLEDHAVFRMLFQKLREHPNHISKTVPEDVRNLVTSCWNYTAEQRPSFRSIVDQLNVMIQLNYPPPPPEEQTVRLIPNCRPLTISEYEALYYSNRDWLEPVRKAPMDTTKRRTLVTKNKEILKKNEEQKKKSAPPPPPPKTGTQVEPQSKQRKTAGKETKSPVSRSPSSSKKQKEPTPLITYRRMRKVLRKIRPRRQMKVKLKIYRRKRREYRRKARLLVELQNERLKATNKKELLVKVESEARIIPQYEKLVHLYWKLSETKWRKMAPTRQTRCRLRPTRRINYKSKYPISRNGKGEKRRIKPLRDQRSKRVAFKKPVFPPMPQLRLHSVKRKNRQEKSTETKLQTKMDQNKWAGLEPKKKAKLLKKKKRQVKRREHRFFKRINRQRKRKRRRAKERERRRRKMRRRYRRLKRRIRVDALTWDQKQRMEELIIRRRERQRRLNRKHRDTKIGRILQLWRQMRSLMASQVYKRVRDKQKKVMEMNEVLLAAYGKGNVRNGERKKKKTKRAGNNKEERTNGDEKKNRKRNKEERSRNKEERTRNKEERTRNKEERTRNDRTKK